MSPENAAPEQTVHQVAVVTTTAATTAVVSTAPQVVTQQPFYQSPTPDADFYQPPPQQQEPQQPTVSLNQVPVPEPQAVVVPQPSLETQPYALVQPSYGPTDQVSDLSAGIEQLGIPQLYSPHLPLGADSQPMLGSYSDFYKPAPRLLNQPEGTDWAFLGLGT